MNETKTEIIERVEHQEDIDLHRDLITEVYVLPGTDFSIWAIGISSWIFLLYLLAGIFGYFN